jgi:hypothetical protein
MQEEDGSTKHDEKTAYAKEEEKRPTAERFVTADIGEVVKRSADAGGNKESELARPGVERFQTAQEYPH